MSNVNGSGSGTGSGSGNGAGSADGRNGVGNGADRRDPMPGWDLLADLPSLPEMDNAAGVRASPRVAIVPRSAPDITSADRTTEGLRRCSVLRTNGSGRCPASVVVPTDFCEQHGGYRARAGMIAKRKYVDLMKGSESLREAFALFYADEDVSDVRAELALQRTLLAAFLEQLGAGAGDEGFDANRINPQIIAGITLLNKAIAELAEQVSKTEARNPTSVSISQIAWVIGQVVDGIAEAVACEITGPVEISAESQEFDNGDVVENHRPADVVRRRILARVADAMEAVLVPTLTTTPAKTSHRRATEGGS